MKNIQNVKKIRILLIVAAFVLVLGIGYASISAINLIVSGNGTASVSQENYNVHFITTDNTPSVSAGFGTASIDSNDDTKAYFNISGLSKKGDSAIATYSIKNDSNGIAARISLDLNEIDSNYLRVTERIEDTELQPGDITIATVKVEMVRTPIDTGATIEILAKLKATPIEQSEATGNSPAVMNSDDPVSFATDSWETIRRAVYYNNTSAYKLGDTKEIPINGKEYTVRIANMSNGDNCGREDYSETACGFVVEFVDPITKMRLAYNGSNKGGYPASDVYSYFKRTVFDKLPDDLKTIILDTRVISGYGNNNLDTANFITIDRLYLLSPKEIYGDELSGIGFYDTSSELTRQLDYYKDNGVKYSYHEFSGENLNFAIKSYNGSNAAWWLRSADSRYDNRSIYVNSEGKMTSSYGYNQNAIAPAFRIG